MTLKRGLTPSGRVRFTPEYDEALKLARENQVSVQEVISEALKEN